MQAVKQILRLPLKWKLSRYLTVFPILLFLPILTSAQNCNFTISGIVKDVSTGNPLAYANIYIKESKLRTFTDSLGLFKFRTVCAGNYHLIVSHISCQAKELYLNVMGDTRVVVRLDHSDQFLDEVAIIGTNGKVGTQEKESLNSYMITQNTDKNLATMLENISGVSTIKSGKAVSKPMVHGLYGNRLTILNNGVTQAGQQWGIDHSPEIDPLIAHKITVIKGVGALEYQGNSLGSVVLVEPKPITKEPHIHGEGRYFFQTNGLGNGLNLELQQYHKKLAWRATGTLKKSGDNYTPNYYLRNTGSEEANFALQFEKSFQKNWFANLYFSTFNSRSGILRGSHIGNLSDLKEALRRDVPFYTRDKFSYTIDVPYQNVNHHLLKFHSKYFIKEKQHIDLTYAGQYNLRKEFDVRRSGRSKIPALSLEQFSNFLEVIYKNYLLENWNLKIGIQFNRIDNKNLPETGILPLIPDYISYDYGLFGIAVKSIAKTTFEFGGRYDFKSRRVATISLSVPRKIIRYKNDYHNLSAVGGISHKFSKKLKLTYHIGYAARNPEINELYSNGLHQGVSGIEEGNPNLNKEVSMKNTLSLHGNINKKLFCELLLYYQNIKDYIFLNPQG